MEKREILLILFHFLFPPAAVTPSEGTMPCSIFSLFINEIGENSLFPAGWGTQKDHRGFFVTGEVGKGQRLKAG